MTTLFINISGLYGIREEPHLLRGKDLGDLPLIENAFLLVEDGLITEYGAMYELELKVPALPAIVENMSGRLMLPAWCDSHTHLVFTGSREMEFIDKIKGLDYAAIAAKGGGILNSAEKLNAATEAELMSAALERLNEIAALGTGAVEIKSGYGLTVEGELKMLRVIKKLKEASPLIIRATFLGAHAFPAAFKQDHRGYIDSIINEMLPKIAAEKLADYIDVFCEKGFFSAEETSEILQAGAKYGLKPKIHVNQLNSVGGIEAGIAAGAVSMDHLETLSAEEVRLLGAYQGCSTLLPTAAFFLRMPYQPARDLIDAGAAVVLASDYNPGSSPSGNMNFVAALSCIQLRMLPEEVVNAGTLNGAYAMGVESLAGSITTGKRANLIVTRPVPSLPYLFYRFGNNLVDKVMISGQWVG